MRAIGVNAFGGADALELIDLPVPEPGPGAVHVRVAAGARQTGPGQAQVRAGTHPTPPRAG